MVGVAAVVGVVVVGVVAVVVGAGAAVSPAGARGRTEVVGRPPAAGRSGSRRSM